MFHLRPGVNRHKAGFIYVDDDLSYVPDVTVYDPNRFVVDTGLVDADGKPITYTKGGFRQPIGFLWPSKTEETQ